MASRDLGEGPRVAAATGAWIVFEDEAGQTLRPARARTWAPARAHAGRAGLGVVPLYAALAAIHLEMSGRAANACLPLCYKLAGALRHLGFDADVMAAYVEVSRGERRFTNIGAKGPATVYTDWTTNGHSIVWADSFVRLVDPTVA